jgi:hypothetical protein
VLREDLEDAGCTEFLFELAALIENDVNRYFG